MELKVTKERVLKAASTCPQTKRALQELFPEAFEPEVQYFKAGTLFMVDQESLYAGDDLNRNRDNVTVCVACAVEGIPGLGEKYINRSEIYMLAHTKNAHEYTLNNLGTGYNWKRGKVYFRRPIKTDFVRNRTEMSGVEIPNEDLKGLVLLRVGCGR